MSHICNHCNKTFNLANVEVVSRYADATVFKMPCCGRIADDRTWVSQPYREARPNAFLVGPVFDGGEAT